VSIVKLAEARAVVQLDFAQPRPGTKSYSLKLSSQPATPQSPLAPQDLISLAREILQTPTDVEDTSKTMASDEDTIVVQHESPTSRFTAVNGKEQPPSNGATGSESGTRHSDDRPNGQPRISPPGQEKLTITTTTTQREDWGAPINGERGPYQQGPSYPDTEGSHKRKRSGSLDRERTPSNVYHSHSLSTPSAKETPTTATTIEADTPRDENMSASHGHSRDPYSSTSQYRSFHMGDQTPRDGHAEDQPWHAGYRQGQISSDEHLSEVLQRETQSIDAQQRDYQHGSPDDDDRSSNHYGGYGTDGRREMSVQSDPKKRKRNFSNRTKTGCMTCRRRKKKCDETKPECKYLTLTTKLAYIDPYFKATTVYEEDLFAPVINKEDHGRRPSKNKHPFPSSQRQTTRVATNHHLTQTNM
jgi:hypothetical protein